MDTKQLKQKILDLAIRGKLVPQDPKDEPASVLLERIRKEKEQLIASGKLKKTKFKTTDTPHYENVPFEIPDSWEWTTIGELLINRDSERIPISSAVREKQTNKIYPYYGAAGIIDKVDEYLFSERLLLIGEDGANLLSKSKDNAFFAEGQYWVNNHAHVLDCSNKLILDFVAFVINASTLDEYITGSAQPKLSQDNLNRIYIPLPPLEEQRRIIEAKQKWFNLIDELNTNKTELQEAIKAAKSKILSLAISGKLVPQDRNDEPAIELLKRINPHFVPCDTSHYENLPEGWTILTVGEVADYINGRAFKPSEWEQTGLPIIRIQNLNDEEAAYNYSTAHFEDKYLVHNGDLLFAWAASLGTYIWQKEDAWLNQHIFKVIPKPFIERDFLYYSFINMIDDFYAESHGSGMVHITKGKFETRPILIPPLVEQKRIVERIETIFAQLDTITAEL